MSVIRQQEWCHNWPQRIIPINALLTWILLDERYPIEKDSLSKIYGTFSITAADFRMGTCPSLHIAYIWTENRTTRIPFNTELSGKWCSSPLFSNGPREAPSCRYQTQVQPMHYSEKEWTWNWWWGAEKRGPISMEPNYFSAITSFV